MAYGFSEPDSIFHFVTLMWIVGPNFMDFSGFKEALECKDLDEAGRIDALYNVDSELSAELSSTQMIQPGGGFIHDRSATDRLRGQNR